MNCVILFVVCHISYTKIGSDAPKTLESRKYWLLKPYILPQCPTTSVVYL